MYFKGILILLIIVLAGILGYSFFTQKLEETTLHLLRAHLESYDGKCARVGSESSYRSCTMTSSWITDLRWKIITTYTGLADDSVDAERYIATVIYRNGEWILESVVVEFICQPGRGHQDWSTELCL